MHPIPIEHQLLLFHLFNKLELSTRQRRIVRLVYHAHGKPLVAVRSAYRFKRGDYRRAV